MNSQCFDSEIAHAMRSDPAQLIMAARQAVARTGKDAETLAASYGYALTVKATVYTDDGAKAWPSTLAQMLCDSPHLAAGKSSDIATKLTEALSLGKPFAPARLSKPLSAAALSYVRPILAQHGYETSAIKRGSDIVRTVRNNIRAGTSVPDTVTTKFYADRVEIDGVSFAYRQRDRVPTGHAWNDLALRLTIGVSGIDVPLAAVLKLRKISIGTFVAADAAALASDGAAALERRSALDRLPQRHPAIARLTRVADTGPQPDLAQFPLCRHKRGIRALLQG